MNLELLSKPSNRWIIGLVIAATATSGAITFYAISQFSPMTKPATPPVATSAPVRKVTALGRLEPEAEVVRIAAPLALDGDRIAQLMVKESDRIKAGQVIAILDSHKRLQDSLKQAQEQVRVAQAKLDQVKAGAKTGEIQAQQAAIARFEAEKATEILAQNATIARLKAEQNTEIEAQNATIARLEAEQQTEMEAQKAAIARLQAEQETEIEAQKATIVKLEAELNNAFVEYQRYQKLYQEGAFSASLRDSKRLSWQTAQQQLKEGKANLRRIQTSKQQQLNEAGANLERIQTSREQQLNEARANLKRIQSSREQQLNEARANLQRIQSSRQQDIKQAKATLDQIAEVRPVDIQAAKMEVESATAALTRAKTELEQAYIKAPMAGQILKIHTRQGEKIGDNGIADMAQTDFMIAVAEVYQTDIAKVQLGQPAVVTSQAFDGELRGVVMQIGLQVNRQNVFSNQPGENLDRRVIEVKIRLNLEDSKRVAGLTNLQVQTAIEL